MKKLVLAAATLIVLATCHKSAPAAAISATINGQNVTFNVSAGAATSAIVADKDRRITLGGYNNGNDSAQLWVSIGDSAVLQTGKTYASVPDSLHFNVALFYKDAAGNVYASEGLVQLPRPHLPATAVITYLSSNRVQGTFSGTVKDTATGSITLQIANGTFDVPLSYTGNPNDPWK